MIAQKVIAFLYFTMIGKFAGISDTGNYFLALSLVTSIGVLDDIGITSVVIRDVAKRPGDAERWARTIVGIKLCTMPITILLAWFLPTFFGYSDQIALLIRIAIVVMIADTLSLSFYGILRGLHVLSYESLGMFVGQTLTALIGGTLVFSGHATLPLLIAALICGSTWNMVFSITQVIRKTSWRSLLPSWEMGWNPLLVALPFFLSGFFIKIYSYAEVHMLEIWKGSEAVGAYAAAYKLTYAFQFLPLAFVAALYPSMSANADKPEVLKKTLLKSFWYMALVGSPIVFGIWSLAPEIVIAFFDKDFTGAILPLQYMIFGLFFIFFDFPLGSLLNATRHQNLKTSIMFGTMIVSVVVNALLIPSLGPLGAAISALISLGGMVVATWIAARRFVPFTIMEAGREVGGSMLAGLLMGLVVVFAKSLVPLWAAVAIGGLAYVVCAVLFRAVTFEQARGLFRLVRPIKPSV